MKTTRKKRFLSSRFVHVAGSFLFSAFLRLLYLTCRKQRYFPESALPYIRGEKPAIFCFWHGRMIMQPFLKPPRPMFVLISHHNDGALITATMRWFGIHAVRTARKKGGTPAIRELVTVTERGDNISITPDGPRGPFQQAAEGAAYVAIKTGYPIVPVTFSARRHWRLRSWDKFMIPKFFTRIHFTIAEPIHLAAESDDTACTAATRHVQHTLANITAQADSACGVTP